MAEERQWQQHSGSVIARQGEFKVIDCVHCGFSHVVPLPTVDELENIYRDEYYSKEKPLYLEGTRRDLEWWKLVFQDRYDEFASHLPSTRRRLLDVGSGPGFFLQFGQDLGWQVFGIEPSRQAVAHARGLGLQIAEGMLNGESTKSLGTFDVVHMNNVLEHVPDPREMITLCRELLNPDGLLCVVVPNDFSSFQRALRDACGFEPWWVAPPHHLNYFNFDSLQKLLETSGFEVLHRETTFPIDLFLLMGENYVGDDDLGRFCHVRRMTFEKNLAAAGMNHVKRKLYRVLAEQGLGREIVLIARYHPEASS